MSKYALLLFFIVVKSERFGDLDFRQFKCRNNRMIQLETFCNGINDCGDGSDEKTHEMADDPFATWQSCVSSHNAKNTSCLIKRELICREDITCTNLTPCDVKCDSHYKCKDSGKCVPRATVCNENCCDGCAEDHGWRNGHGFKCRRNGIPCVLPQQLLHDDISDCDGGVDICFDMVNKSSRNELQPDERLLRDKCFQCLDYSMLVPTSRVCDGVIDCPDMSDECLCKNKKKLPKICNDIVDFSKTKGSGGKIKRSRKSRCVAGSVRCSKDVCIPRSSICDGVKDCENDEKFRYCRGTINCKDSTRKEKRCRCRVYGQICKNNYGTACDGVPDCPAYDPGGFDSEKNSFPEDECEAFCNDEPSQFQCKRSRGIPLLPSSAVIPCHPAPNDFARNDTNRPFLTQINSHQKCDGVENCILGDDEKDCPNRFPCDVFKQGYVSIKIEQTCDGIEHCRDGADETEELCGDKRFHCQVLGGKMVNIDPALVCDFHITCDDASDEKNCSDGRFYCENENPLFVVGRKTFNGKGDCTDWSDECPTEDLEASSFSSRHQLIANPLLRFLVWAIGLLSLGGNAKLRMNQNLSPIAMANRLLILNLAASDIIMGVYLLSLGVAGLHMQGKYCSQDLQWRSSSSCVMLGILSVLSSETSVMTMILLTSCRLYAVVRPFESTCRPRRRTICVMIASTWIISFTLALVPLSPSLSATFVSQVQYKDSLFFSNSRTTLEEAQKLFEKLLTFDLKPNAMIPEMAVKDLSWLEIQTMSDAIFAHKHFEGESFFGYYSADSVCIPKFFVTTSDRAWGFSLFINIFNFCSFIFVATAYLKIYMQSRKREKMRSSHSRNNEKGVTDLQKKILRLIITDFCCWIPICIMAFARLGGANTFPKAAYVFAAIILLPINSALNPLLYSNVPDIIFGAASKKFRRWQKPAITSVSDVSKNSSGTSGKGTSNATFEMTGRKSSSKGEHKESKGNCLFPVSPVKETDSCCPQYQRKMDESAVKSD